MRHWYLLVKDLTPPAPPASACPDHFVSWGGPTEPEVTPRSLRTRLFILGAFEMLPVGFGIWLGVYFEPTVPYTAAVTAELALSVLLCWLLRHQTPPTVIHAISSHSEPKHEGSDAKTV